MAHGVIFMIHGGTRQLKCTRRPFFQGALDVTIFFWVHLKGTRRHTAAYLIIYEFLTTLKDTRRNLHGARWHTATKTHTATIFSGIKYVIAIF